jgi:cytochrome b subunit of formate dehydrogenase
MPRFDRWTYWEKFDFLAVFWGMFAIGTSGLLLWIPEWSSWVIPGWVLNVATLVHSEEALLAALFIFTVHFFNTHFIPTKFPMDPIIFTGRYRLEELKEQKPLQYERLKAAGRLDTLKRKHPSIPLKIVSGIFGLASLLLGLSLTVMILWAIFLA